MMHGTQKDALLGTDAGGTLIARRVRVRITAGPAAGVERVLELGSLIVGSSAGADIRVDDPLVSRTHVEISLVGAGVRVRDLHSTNGTFLGESRIDSAVVQPGVELRLGSVTRVELSAADVPALLAPSERTSFGKLVGESPPMRRLFAILERVAPSDVPLAIEGPEGTGKSLAASAVHEASGRRGAMVVVDLRQPGALRPSVAAAAGGTLVLESLDWAPHHAALELSAELDSAEREGLDVRTIVTSRVDLREAVERGTVPRDLFFRLATVRAFIPPLRERLEDLVPLSRALAHELTGDEADLDEAELSALRQADLGGNVRELRALIEEARVFRWAGSTAPAPLVSLDTLDVGDLAFGEAKERVVEAFEREYVRRLLEKHRHNLSKAADEGGISRNHLTALAKKHGLR